MTVPSSDGPHDPEVERVLAGGGEAGALARSVDWSKTPLGPVATWSQALRSTAAMVLHNHWQMLLWWGPQFVQIYNDAYRPVLGDKHPRAMGQPFRECWAEVFDILGPLADRPFQGGPAATSADMPLLLNRKVAREETHFRLAYSPVPDDTVPGTGIGGVLATVTEITEQAFAERQLRTLGELAARSAAAVQAAEQACAAAASTLRDNPWDVPFAIFYLLDRAGQRAQRVACVGFGDDADADGAAPREVDVTSDRDPTGCVWPLQQVIAERRAVVIDDLSHCPFELPASPWAERPRAAIALPLSSPGQNNNVYGVLVCGLSPHRVLDHGYRTFFELAGAQVVTAVRNARALEEERLRAEALAQIDRAKTAFFSNVSHEFRTPLTLMLGPTEDALSTPDGALRGGELEMVHRNELRLLKLVNALLDFSRIEAGRAQALYEPTDLAASTSAMASSFRSAIERAGLAFHVACEPLPRPVHVDREMWEKIVLNLLSNALKFTFEGQITVALRAVGDSVELKVADTGIGIAEAELPRLFERFHRIEGVRARTHEGSGIGLALMQDLVKLHDGRVSVKSRPGEGTTFTVTLPFESARAREQVTPPRAADATRHAESFVAEALRWLPAPAPSATSPDPAAQAHILFADDNADMREYVERLLLQQPQGWTVEAVADGVAALAAARTRRPDVILTDVMMPNLDGVGLLRALRADAELSNIPVIMLSARAGEEARLEGLDAGADEYLVKPFSARELLARLNSQIKLARTRAESARERADLLAREQNLRSIAEEATRAKDEFLAMLGHELRNPLSPILTAVQLMRMRGNDGHEVELIDRQVRHLVRLVDDLLDVSRITRGKIELRRERQELAEVALHGLEIASPLLEQRRQEVDFEVPVEGLPVDGDPDRLAQVVSNLITNASKYSEPGTRIVISATRAEAKVRLHVRDHGIGIAPGMVERIFDIFIQQPQTLDRAKGGLGLGLTIVRSLVMLHGGTVEAHSAGVGHGSEFIVTLPLAPAGGSDPLATPSPRRARTTPSAPSVRARRIMIVDDNDDAAATIAEVLAELGHEVGVAHDGPSALTLAAQLKPDVCLLDIGLPVMDGYELARKLRESRDLPEGARIIALTGYGQDADRRRSSEAGFSAHMVKPVDLELLTSVVAN